MTQQAASEHRCCLLLFSCLPIYERTKMLFIYYWLNCNKSYETDDNNRKNVMFGGLKICYHYDDVF